MIIMKILYKPKEMIYTGAIICFILLLFSCNDFLDKVPDNRAELKTPEQISKLLVSGYPISNYALITELSSDNFVDNNSPDNQGNYYNLSSFEQMDDEIFAWEDISSATQQDSPAFVWENSYYSIAVANHALSRIYELEKEGKGEKVSAQKGEALLIRAFNHFNLINLFAPVYSTEAQMTDIPGIPYVTEPEKEVMVLKERLSVSEVYKRIEQDLIMGLSLIDDNNYKVPKYHFNKKAANAFATRFYLYKRDYEKVIKYASEVLGEDPSLFMRNWNVSLTTFNSKVYWLIDETSPSNLLLIPTHSRFMRRYAEAYRYTCNREAASATIYGSGPSWSSYEFHPCFLGKLYISGSQKHGVWFPNAGELFEYTNLVSGTGYPHIVRKEFTCEETLLCRAEAYVHLNKPDLALSDLQVWNLARQNLPGTYRFQILSETTMKSFYSNPKNKEMAKPLNTTSIDPSWQVDEHQKFMLYCILHFRRIETAFEGLRWFDIKRYGIEIEHKIGKNRVEVLSINDSRRVFQIPSEVIAAGLVPNERQLVDVSTPNTISLPPKNMND